MAAIDDHAHADYQFYHIALQYCGAGRFAALTAMMPVSSNLIHHAVEMMLKGRLTHALTLQQMAAPPYRHCLPRIWQAFKALFPSENLTRFDQFIDSINPQAYLRPYKAAAEVIQRHNVSCQGWFPDHPRPLRTPDEKRFKASARSKPLSARTGERQSLRWPRQTCRRCGCAEPRDKTQESCGSGWGGL